MTIRANKDCEAWDPRSGFVYDAAGAVKRAGLPGHTPLTPAAVRAAVKEAGLAFNAKGLVLEVE